MAETDAYNFNQRKLRVGATEFPPYNNACAFDEQQKCLNPGINVELFETIVKILGVENFELIRVRHAHDLIEVGSS